MSLFKTKEWWATKTSSEEECDFGCLCVANIDNGKDDKIIVGSYHGILHIYSPSEGDGGQNPHDTLLESQTQGPILQILAGRFVSVSKDTHLAVLQPRNVTIYAIAIKEGAVDHGNQCIMNKIYEHRLERTAANMTSGPFGGVKDRDFLCVQSMDGSLSIFESENFTFTRFIPGFLMPGPLAYCARIDSFITLSSNRNLEAYSFQVLAVAMSSERKEESQKITSGKKINADWKLNIGESALDIKIVPLANRSPVIMVLGERSFYCVQDTGQIVFMKKLEYNPACFFPYAGEDGKNVNCILCTHSRQMLVYEGISLKWATLLDETPVQVTVGTFRQMPGMIVTLTDQCHVACSYLGTHPSIFNLPRSTQREPDYETIDREMSRLNSKIKDLHISKGDALSKTKESDDLSVKISVPPTIDRVSVAPQHAASSTDGPVPSITVQITLKVTRRVTDVQVTIHVEEPLSCTQKHIKIPAVAESDPIPCATVSFFLQSEFPPASLGFEAVVHYHQSVTGIPKVVTATGQLPLSLVSWPHDPIKTLDYKVTLETNKPCMNLLELFPELTAADAGPNCVGIRLIHGSRTTILTSKSSYRYRVQSETYSGLWLMTEELVKRLQRSNQGSDFRITNQQAITLDDLYPVIDRHFQLRVSKGHVQAMLEQRAQQFRAIQRRMLTRFKDKTPAPLNCLDTLLEGTYRQILALADACEENYQTLLMSNAELSSSLRLVILLTKLWLSLTNEEVALLEHILCISMKDAEMGWEEITDCSLSSLIRTTLSKSGKDAGVPQPTQTMLKLPDDPSKVKKHIGILFDRLSKGARLIPSMQSNHKNHTSGPISNISIKQGKGKSAPNGFQPPPLTRGMSDDEDVTEDEQSALISDIINSTPLKPTTLQPPTSYSTKQENELYAVNNHKVEKDFPPEPADDTTVANNGILDMPKEEPHGNMSKPPNVGAEDTEVAAETDHDIFNGNDDIIESPSFYDNAVDDILSM